MPRGSPSSSSISESPFQSRHFRVAISESPFASGFLSISPIFGDLCKDVSCGKGNCSITKNSTVPFECVCEPGWKQPTSGFNFLPCIIPNCTIDISYSKATSAAAAPKSTTNGSIFDPCSWNICGGGGTCKRSSSNSSYSCSCNTGFKNLMNSTSFPCYPECGLGGDCPKLGIPLFNQSNSPSLAHSVEGSTNLESTKHLEDLPHLPAHVLATKPADGLHQDAAGPVHLGSDHVTKAASGNKGQDPLDLNTLQREIEKSIANHMTSLGNFDLFTPRCFLWLAGVLLVFQVAKFVRSVLSSSAKLIDGWINPTKTSTPPETGEATIEAPSTPCDSTPLTNFFYSVRK